MKCDDVQKHIDLGLKNDSLELEQSYKSHIESCDDCRKYLNRAIQLGDLLGGQKFEVMPGELDDITFEKIVAASDRPARKIGLIRNIFSVRWAWVPVAAAAIFVMFAVFPGKVNHDIEGDTITIIDPSPPFTLYIRGELDSTSLTDFAKIDSGLELLEEAVIYNSDVENLIENLTDEEFDMLYDRLKSKSGSAG